MLSQNKPTIKSRARTTGKFLFYTLLIAIVGVLLIGGALLFEPEKPAIVLQKDISHIGKDVTLPLQVSDKRSGVKSVRVSIIQGDAEKEVYTKIYPRKGWFAKAGPSQHADTIAFDTKSKDLKDGPAELVVSVRDFSMNGFLKGNETALRLPVTVDTRPPAVRVKHSQRYIIPGGSGIVLYSLSEESDKHGVMIDETFFPGFPVADKDNLFISYIALEWNAAQISQSYVLAEDQAGNQGKTMFSVILRRVAEKKDNINISDNFLNSKIPEFESYYPDLTGTNIEKFIQINNTVRVSNSRTIKKICTNPLPQQLWKDRFLRMPGASMAGFADQRTYLYQGEAIDNQVHLGRDIASTANAEIKAANHGKVVFADYLGIYGYMVILDHGQGVFSLYSHLSRIDTTLDKLVAQGDVIGHSGATGMAGGDHLHFSVLINGIFVNPLEWWDQHWIDVNIIDALKDSGL